MDQNENSIYPDGSGKRYNQGKTRYDLIPAFANEQYAKVLTVGADKYGEWNWDKGMKWTTIMASLKRHLHANILTIIKNSNIQSSDNIVNYIPPNPPKDSPDHTYKIIVYRQDSRIKMNVF